MPVQRVLSGPTLCLFAPDPFHLIILKPSPHRHRILPHLYRGLLTLTRKHGLFTLARLHHRLWKGEQQVSIAGGAELLMPGDTHYFGFLAGVHERHITNLVNSIVVAGDPCIDVGANIGYFSMMMAARAGSSGRVLAFEPVPETYACLQKNAALAAKQGWLLEPFQKAVSAEAGRVSIQRHEHSTLHQVQKLAHSAPAASEEITCVSLDQVLKDNSIASVKLLKIDVEGHETQVIAGAMHSLQSGKVQHLVIEVTPGKDAESIGQMLADLKVKPLCWVDDSWKSIPVSQLEHRTDVWVSF
jgi:FkbM family methyltransferase